VSGPSVVVRAATDDEATACVHLWVAAVAERDGEPASDAVRQRAAAKFAVPRVALAVAVEDDRPIGFALVTAPDTGDDDLGDAAYLSLLAVDPRVQGRGLGRSLLRAAVEAAGRAGYSRCLLHALDDNAPALRLYRSAGFRPVGAAFPHALSGRPTRAWVTAPAPGARGRPSATGPTSLGERPAGTAAGTGS